MPIVSPADLPSLIAWIEPEQAVEDYRGVTALTDQAGTTWALRRGATDDRHQAYVQRRPLGPRDGLFFADRAVLRTEFAERTGPVTVFAVVDLANLTSDTNDQINLVSSRWETGALSGPTGWNVLMHAAEGWNLNRRSTALDGTSHGSPSSQRTGLGIAVARLTQTPSAQGSILGRWQGVTYVDDAAGEDLADPFAWTQVLVGRQGSTLGTVIVYAAALTDVEVADVEAWLIAQWDLTGPSRLPIEGARPAVRTTVDTPVAAVPSIVAHYRAQDLTVADGGSVTAWLPAVGPPEMFHQGLPTIITPPTYQAARASFNGLPVVSTVRPDPAVAVAFADTTVPRPAPVALGSGDVDVFVVCEANPEGETPLGGVLDDSWLFYFLAPLTEDGASYVYFQAALWNTASVPYVYVERYAWDADTSTETLSWETWQFDPSVAVLVHCKFHETLSVEVNGVTPPLHAGGSGENLPWTPPAPMRTTDPPFTDAMSNVWAAEIALGAGMTPAEAAEVSAHLRDKYALFAVGVARWPLVHLGPRTEPPRVYAGTIDLAGDLPMLTSTWARLSTEVPVAPAPDGTTASPGDLMDHAGTVWQTADGSHQQEPGIDGDWTAVGTYAGEWDPDTTYTAGEVVISEGLAWTAAAGSTGVQPTLDAAEWTLIEDRYLGPWGGGPVVIEVLVEEQDVEYDDPIIVDGRPV